MVGQERVLLGLQSLKDGVSGTDIQAKPGVHWAPLQFEPSVLSGQEGRGPVGGQRICGQCRPSIPSKAQPFRMSWSLKILSVKNVLPLRGCGETHMPFTPICLSFLSGEGPAFQGGQPFLSEYEVL